MTLGHCVINMHPRVGYLDPLYCSLEAYFRYFPHSGNGFESASLFHLNVSTVRNFSKPSVVCVSE